MRIHVYGEDDLSFDALLIGQNGRISYPFLGELTVTGKTASQLQAEITAGLKPDYLVDPRVSVSVVKYRPFFVNGEVKNPGGVDFQPGLTLRKAISLAGGFTERANKKEALVISDSDPGPQGAGSGPGLQRAARRHHHRAGYLLLMNANERDPTRRADPVRPIQPGSQMRAPNPPMDDDFIDLGRLFRAVMRHKWAILALAFAITLATGLLVYSMEPVYKASASLVLESEEANVVNVEQVYSLGSGNYEYSQTQFEILKSRSLAERVVRKLKLYEHPDFLPKTEAQEKPWYSIDLKALLPASNKAPPVQLTAEEKQEQLIQAITDARGRRPHRDPGGIQLYRLPRASRAPTRSWRRRSSMPSPRSSSTATWRPACRARCRPPAGSASGWRS